MTVPKKIHLTSQTYLRNWAINEKINWTKVSTGVTEPRDVENVAFRRKWWGHNPVLTQAAEDALWEVENAATDFLRDPVAHWPVGEFRVTLAQFVAIHVARTAAWRRWFEGTVLETIAENVEQQPVLEREIIGIGERLLRPEAQAEYVFRQILRLASLFASMHWTLVRFDGELLAISDQPVTPVPMGVLNGAARVGAMPESGFAEIVEIRIPIRPDIALVCSWRDDEDEQSVRTGSHAHACNLNTSTIKQAERGWGRKPGTHAPRLAPPLLQPFSYPLSPQLFPDLTPAAMLRSERRHSANALLRTLIDEDRVDVVADRQRPRERLNLRRDELTNFGSEHLDPPDGERPLHRAARGASP